MIEVLRAAPGTTVQDLGRPGLAHLGVGRSGAADRVSLRLANRLVGNPPGAACLEVTLGGLAIRAEAAYAIAVTGADCPVLVDGVRCDHSLALRVQAGQVLKLGPAGRGVRAYLAVAGGVDVTPVLGSRSTDALAGIGPPPVGAGDRLPIGRPHHPPPAIDVVPLAPLPDEPLLRVLPGPREDWLTPEALTTLTTTPYAVQPDSDRVGLRLRGATPLTRRRPEELPSEGLVVGALQVPPDGQPVLFLADHPVTGGYPVLAVVHPDDLRYAAQARPGQVVRFVRDHRAGAHVAACRA